MATRYWRNTGTWDASSTSNWSDSSGGATGFSAPTSDDDVIFDNASAAANFTCTIGTGAVCRNITVNTLVGKTLTFAGSAALNVHGSLTFPASNVARTYTGATVFRATTAGNTINFNGLAWAPLAFDGVGGEWTLASAITSASVASNGYTLTLARGTFRTGNYNITSYRLMGSASVSATGARAFYAGSSTITSANNTSAATGYSLGSCTDPENFTMDPGTSTFIFQRILNGEFLNSRFYNLEIRTNGALNSLRLGISGGNISSDSNPTFSNATGIVVLNNFTIVKGTTANNAVICIVNNSTIPNPALTVQGTLSTSDFGTSGDFKLYGGRTNGAFASRNKPVVVLNSVGSLAGMSVYGCAITGSAAPITLGARASDMGMTSGIVTRSPRTSYLVNWTAGTDGWWSSTRWASSSGGTPSANDVPDRYYDSIIIDNNSLNAGTVSISQGFGIGSLDLSSRTTAISLGLFFVNGSFILSNAVTLTSSINFCGTGNMLVNTSGKTLPGGGLCNGTLTLQGAFTVSSVFYHTGGTFDDNGNTVNFTGYIHEDVATRNPILDGTFNAPRTKCSGTWNMSGPTSGYDFMQLTSLSHTVSGPPYTYIENLFSVTTGTINLNGPNDNKISGLKTTGSNKLPAIVGGSTTAPIEINSSATFKSFSVVFPRTVKFHNGTDNTFEAFSITGSGLGNITLTVADTVTSPVVNATLRKSTPWLMGASSTDAGNNVGLTFGSGDGTIDNVIVSYITGAALVPTVTASGNMFLLFN